MAIPYIPLTDEEKFFHIEKMVDDNGLPVSGILASGEANYYDPFQIMVSNPIDVTYTNPIEPYGLIFSQNSSLSNARLSLEYSINDFSTFSPYIHNAPSPLGGIGYLDKYKYAFVIDISPFYFLGSLQFNLSR